MKASGNEAPAPEWERHAAILDALPAHIALIDSQGVILTVNESWRRFASANVLQSPNFLVGENYIHVCERAQGECSEEARAAAEGIRRVLAGATAEFSIEYPCHSPGERRWFRLMVTPLGQGSVTAAVVMHINVTERRAAEEALKAREREQREIAEQLAAETRRLHDSQMVASIGSWETEIASGEVNWTEETFRIFETTPDKFDPSHEGFFDFVHPEDRERVREAFDDSLNKPGVFSVEHRLLLRGGKIKHIEERWQTFRDESGRAVRALGTCQDITRQASIRAALEQSEERLRKLHEHTPDAIYLMDLEGRFVDSNPAGEKLLGFSRTELIGTNFLDLNLLSPTEAARASEALGRAVRGEATSSNEYEVTLRNGRGITVEFEGFPISIGSQAFVLGVGREITARKRAELRISRASKLYALLSRVNEAILRAQGRERLFEAVCRIVVQDELFTKAALLALDPASGVVRVKAQAGAEAEFFSNVAEAMSDPSSLPASPAGPLVTGQPQHCDLLAAGPWARSLVERGCSSAASFPLKISGEVAGALALFTPDPRHFEEEETKLLLAVAENIAFALDAMDREARRLQAEKICRESEANMAAAQRIAHIGSWELMLDPSGGPTINSLRWSDEMHRIAGFEPGAVEVTRSFFYSLVPEVERAQIEQEVAAAVRERKPYAITHHLRRADGAVRIIHEVGQVILDEETGRPLKLVGAAHDITERAAAEAARRESDERFRQLAENIEEVFWLTDVDWNEILYISPSYEGVWGRSCSDLYNRPRQWIEAVHPEDRAGVLRSIHQPPAGEYRQEYRIVRPDGSIRWIANRAFPIQNASGETYRIAGVARDITEQKTMEGSLRASEERFRTLFELAPDAIYLVGMDGVFVGGNKASEQITGYSRAELIGSNFLALGLLRGEDAMRAAEGLERNRAGEPTGPNEFTLYRKDNATVPVEIHSFPITLEGQPLVLGVARDITERHEAELDLKRHARGLKLLSACNEALIHAEDETVLLDQICRLTVDVGGYTMAWVGYAEEGADRRIRPVAWAGQEEGYLGEIKLTWDPEQPGGNGPAARTIRGGAPVLCNNIQGDPGFYFKAPADKRGYRSVLCLPLRDGAKTIGLLALYSDREIHAGIEEQKLLQDLADNLSFGIITTRARVDRQKLQEAVLAIARGVSATVGDAFFESLNRHTIRALEADGGLIVLLDGAGSSEGATLSAVIQGRAAPNFTIKLGSGPFEEIARGKTVVIDQGLQRLFPEDPIVKERQMDAVAGTPLVDSHGDVLGFIAVLFQQPIRQKEFIPSTLHIFAARAAAEMERQQTDAQVREQAALLDAAHEAILVKNLEDEIVYWNKGAERLYGWTSAEALGKKSGSFLYAPSDDFGRAQREVIERGSWEGELGGVTSKGRELIVQASWTLVRDSKGRPKSVLAINSDLTEKKKLEAHFLRSQRMESIGTLAGGIAHDLNNVLAPIMMALEMLKDLAVTAQDHQLLDSLMLNAQRGADLVRQVLSFARGVEGQRVSVDVLPLARELAKVMRDTFPRNIVAALKPAPGLWRVTGDPTQIHQVLMNLCVNARDAMPQGGSLTLTLTNSIVDDTYAGMNPDAKPGPYLLIKVADTGEGIPPELRERIFEPFFTTKEIGKGTGLGLSTTLAIVKSHGGFIHLYSEVGKGSTFSVYLPTDNAAPRATEEAASPAASLPRGTGEMILVVDDEENIRQVAKATLERHGYSVILASHGAEAIAIYVQRRADIAAIITDMAMPIMDGPALIVAIKALNPRARIIASSGLSANPGATGPSGAGVEHFIPKPYTAETMLRALSAALSRG